MVYMLLLVPDPMFLLFLCSYVYTVSRLNTLSFQPVAILHRVVVLYVKYNYGFTVPLNLGNLFSNKCPLICIILLQN